MKKILYFSILVSLILLSIAAVSAEDNSIILGDENAVDELEGIESVELLDSETNDGIVDEDLTTLENIGEDSSDVVSENQISSGDEILISGGVDENLISGEDGGDDSDDDEVPVIKKTSKITASNVKGYASFTTAINIKLSANGTALSSKKIHITLNGVTYNKTTDANGNVKLNVKLNKGSYIANIKYLGDDLTTETNKTCKVTIGSSTKTKLKIGDKNINYRQGSKCLFYVKLLDAKNKALKNKNITFKVAGKTYMAKTNKNGIAKIYLNLKKGTYKVRYYFKKNAPYLASSGYYKIKVRPKMTKGNGYWLWGLHMKKVNLKRLSKKGTKHIFLNVQAIGLYGKSAVKSFIKRAHKHGIKVHLWMQVCFMNGKWISPINKKTQKLKYSFLNRKIREAKSYAKIKGVDGVHFDYLRFGGTAHKYKNPNRAMNYFMKKVSTQIHKAKPNCIVSAAVMPEPKMMEYYYGQDVPTISKYADALLPMVYKGNYKKQRPWITSVTKKFVNQSNGAQIWVGLQSYRSDKDARKLSHSALLKDSKAAMKGGAKGVVLFRIGISCYLNFKRV